MARRKLREGKRPEPWNATQARGKGFAATRKLKNRIYELEQELAIVQRREAHANAQKVDAERRAVIAQPTENQLNSLRRICHVPLTKVVELGLSAPAIVIAEWVVELEKARK